MLAGWHTPTWVLLPLVAAAGLLAGYSLSVVEHLSIGQTGTVLAGFKLKPAPAGNYTVFNSKTWSRTPWGMPCPALLPRIAAAGRTMFDSKQLCDLPSIWSNCSQGIYLDIGTNLGVQLRKLYDPQQFPNATVLPVFDKMFGMQRKGVCAVGVEANVHHAP
jgi:hypothetical protein